MIAPQLSQAGASVWNEANCSLRMACELTASDKTAVVRRSAAAAADRLRFAARR